MFAFKFHLTDEVPEKDKKKKPYDEVQIVEKPVEEVKTVKRLRSRSRSPAVMHAFADTDRTSQGLVVNIIPTILIVNLQEFVFQMKNLGGCGSPWAKTAYKARCPCRQSKRSPGP